MHQLNAEGYFGFYFALFNATGTEALPLLAEQNGVAQEAFAACIGEGPSTRLREEMREVEWFGMTATQPRFYIGLNGKDNTVIEGVPEFDRFRIALRNNQLLIGQ